MPDCNLPPGTGSDPDDLGELDTWAYTLLARAESEHAVAAAEALARLGPESVIAVLGRAGPASIAAVAFARLADVLGPQALVECLLGPRPHSAWVWHGALEYLPARVAETRLRRVLEVALTDETLPATVCARALDLAFRLLVDDRALVGGLVRPLERLLWAQEKPEELRRRVLDLLLASQPAAERPAWSMRLLARARARLDWPLVRRLLARLAPADVTPRCARRIADLLREPGVPDAVPRAALTCLLRCSTDPLEPLLERCLPLGAVPALFLCTSPHALAEELPNERLAPLLARGLRCVSHALAAQLERGAPAAGFAGLASWMEEAVELLRALRPGVDVGGLVDGDLELRALEVVHFRHRGAAAFAAAADLLGVAGSGRAIRVLGRHLEPGSRATGAERLLVRSAIERIRARIGAAGAGGLAVVDAPAEGGRLSVAGGAGELSPAAGAGEAGEAGGAEDAEDAEGAGEASAGGAEDG
ncbi:MAG: hypothetical protein HZA54_04205 [Planctomycetes bacterium]|nr:hypothetical protein [Planctomycetota bacterium]